MAFLIISQNNATRVIPFFLVLSSDHITGATGKTPAVKISKNGAGGITPTGAITETDSTNLPGWYQIAANATDANTLGSLALHVTATGCDPADYVYDVVALNRDDTVRAGLTALPNAAAGSTGGLDCTVTLGGTASAGGANTITLTGGVATDNYYNHEVVQITGGTGAGQARTIIGYVGSTKVATVSRAWTTNPDNTSTFQVKGFEMTPTWTLLAGTLAAGSATTATLTGGVATDNYYNGALLVITAGTGQRQARVISGYVGSTTIATVDHAWTSNPDSTSVFVVYAADAPKLDANLQTTAASVQGNVTGSVASVTGGVTVTTNNDKTGYGLANNAVDAAQFSQAAADKVWSSAARTLTAISTTILGAVWDALRSAHTSAGSFGEGIASVQGNVTGSAASVTGAVGSVTGNVSGNVTGTIGDLAGTAQTTVKNQVVSAIATDTYAEPSAVPAATSSLKDKIGWMMLLARNKLTQTSTTQLARNAGDTGTVGTSMVSDDGNTFTRGGFT